MSLQAHAADSADSQAKTALWVVMDAKNGREDEVAKFLIGGKAVVLDEPATSSWFAVRLSKSRFAIFDTFPSEAGRDAHLSGKVAAALMAKAPDMLQRPPSIEKIDVLAAKLPNAK
ncbi:putative quinol monooxygenase [Caldimonas brevitalea]|uniref:Antibiotic biosynthesis monooxygenase n=1 Tax=Caldimonas brevitalea TaxID=413882 RepID=A0A0G3BX39_9BURK|nr:antibiotic biosynthesis monooxygenase [Caldimonas brevitalea]AKJ31931.1 antibiotic biosynthesis monooxygenase [Caldimonas brevitalea]